MMGDGLDKNMLVTFVSQCEKKALSRSRRILDVFANRIGDNTWQSIITEEGMLAVKKLLRKRATKNTAVSCHWIRSRKRSELLWIIGNRNKFNDQGIVPVNRTKKSLQPWKNSHIWQNLELVALASSIAGLFHDFGKANDLFQEKLNSQNSQSKIKKYEPYRHELVSLKIFEVFVNYNNQEKTDEQWLKKLGTVISDQEFLNELKKDCKCNNLYELINKLPEFAKLIAWLIISHHRLPIYPPYSEKYNIPPSLKYDDKTYKDLSEYWLKGCDVKWNSINYADEEFSSEHKRKNWEFSKGLPFKSLKWQSKAKELSKRSLNQLQKIKEFNWQKDTLTMHLSRLILMLSDHNYSALDAKEKWQDNNYYAYANTDKDKQLKQKLDEHNLAVGHFAYTYSHKVPKFLSELPELGRNRVLDKGIEKGDPKLNNWQDKAVHLSKKLNIRSNECGFFGINMASTGKGKTIANARIMYALSDVEKGCRFSIALGLRVLTTQTGNALKKELKLDDSEIAIIIGSSAVLRLQEALESKNKVKKSKTDQGLEIEEQVGSESLDEYNENFNVEYSDIDPDGLLKEWFGYRNDIKMQKLLHAPILVSTIDFLIPATESLRGGRQIVPMIRLLSSDLIIDEPDELNLEDLPALTRLVNWAGMLGSKVLFSSATIPPAMACALFEAYAKGREKYQQSMLGYSISKPIVCGWFDEFNIESEEINSDDSKNFYKTHRSFVEKRVKNLRDDSIILRKGKILEIEQGNTIEERVSSTLLKGMQEAHKNNHQINKDKVEISIGVIRFANINPLVKIAKSLIKKPLEKDIRIHYCIYHSRFTLAQRSYIEEKLDRILNRKNVDDIWTHDEIKNVINRDPKFKKHLFVVLATSVCEVGRDHDYDWVIAEPSSIRSLVQIAGRIQRHRKQPVNNENVFILNKNIKALQGKDIVFTKPGFEGEKIGRSLSENKEIKNLLLKEQYKNINSIPSIEFFIKPTKERHNNLSVLEHNAYAMTLLGNNDEENNARLWWKNNISWSGELQRRQKFRKSIKDKDFYRNMNSNSDFEWCVYNDEKKKLEPVYYIKDYSDEFDHSYKWFECDEKEIYKKISKLLNLSEKDTYIYYGKVDVPDYDQQYYYNPFLGIFSDIDLNKGDRL